MYPTDPDYCSKANLSLYWRFIYERHRVWYRRFIEGLPRPWTDDLVLREFKFTNVYRELDKGTVYLLDNVVPTPVTEGVHVRGFTPANEIFRIMVYRTFNHIPTWQHLELLDIDTIETWDLDTAINMVHGIKNEGVDRVFTNAHIVSPYTSMPGDSKAEKVCHFLDILHAHIEEITTTIQSKPSLRDVFNYVKSLYGFGPFLAYEIVVDLMYRSTIPFTEDDWANAGPGAMRGSSLIYPNRHDYLQVMESLRDSQQTYFDDFCLPFQEIAYRGRTDDGHLTLRNIEHCLCEFQKYHRAYHGTGRPRNTFHPTSQGDTMWMERLKG